ncbi:pyruvate kinase [Metallosphaera hakonensis]|uniref:Pyruvate kinase n=1 Tax=Metallosphaera hakonensis JCM 8857 = DSM 7519 TaxID=1293036 RepID=A0A2U9IW16_9CREN|nr:pyruvate kinase [Metallosphaera hakonensis]AWS00250.1 pyruvate kinase [Metallosphaera hakonensis JCM 8857 = DSM 7519]
MRRRTKIIATLGPSSENLISSLKDKVDIFRVNLAHGDTESHSKYFELIKTQAPTSSILVDLPGPKLRVGDIGKVELRAGQEILFSMNEGIVVQEPLFYRSVRPGSEILLADGIIKVRVTEVSNDQVKAIVETSGILTSRKGINIPDMVLETGLTDNDFRLMDEALSLGADYIGLSFVLSENDVIKAKSKIQGRAWVISKIEKSQAVQRLFRIVEESDGVMVARGDLGVEIGLENLPYIQRKIIRTSKLLGKPVILATQVLESMVNSPLPSRAEVIDVANSVYQGVDAIMLSDETAAGHYPVEAVQYLDEIITSSEDKVKPLRPSPMRSPDDAIAYAALSLSELSRSDFIAVHSRSGMSVIRVSRLRPKATILAFTPDPSVARKLKLCWGVVPLSIEENVGDLNELVSILDKKCRELGVKGNVVMVAGDPKMESGRTNLLKLHSIDSSLYP